MRRVSRGVPRGGGSSEPKKPVSDHWGTHHHPQVGQCGNQVGCRFWELALREHAAYNAGGRYDEALSSFFENVDARTLPPTPLPLNSHIRTLKVRLRVLMLCAMRRC
jgi:hypothetical protein